MSARVLALAAAAALAAAGCGGGTDAESRPAAPAAAPGDTRAGTWVDRDGDGRLERGPGAPLRVRADLGGSARAAGGELARFAQLTDTHVRDEESPARAPFLDRLGSPFRDAFRPHEALLPHAFAAATRSLNAQRPEAVLVTGDIADSAQANEVDAAIALLRGGTVRPDSGAPGYQGVQEAANPDPAFYRPDVDPPQHPALLDRAQRPFRAPGLRAPWLPLLGNHDALVGGELRPSPATRALATGPLAVTEPPPGLEVPRSEAELTAGLLDELLAEGVAATGAATRAVTPDPARRHLAAATTAARLRTAAGLPGGGDQLQWAADVGPAVRVIGLDTVRRDVGARGRVDAGDVAFLRRELARAGDRWVVVATHEPLERTPGADAVLALLDAHPRTLAALAGSVHRASVRPRRAPNGGWWLLTTPAVADFPMQARMLRVRAAAGGGALLDTWLVDMAPDPLADVARDLAFLDAQGGRPRDMDGDAGDRNVTLVRPAPR